MLFKILIENTNKQIEESTPSKLEIEKNMEEKKKLIAQKQKEKNQWRSKKQDEEKIVTNLNAQKKEKQATFDGIIQPFKDIHQKALNLLPQYAHNHPCQTHPLDNH